MRDAPRIGGRTRLMGLLGEHIDYTQSPRLHNRAAAALGVDAVYLPLPLPRARVQDFLAVAWELGALGFNVTTPHKEHVASLFPDSGLRSANTLYRGPAGWQLASTDGPGFAQGLAQIGAKLSDFRHIVVLGAGGAVAAILAHVAAMEAAMPAVTILRRSAQKDQDLGGLLPPGAALHFADFTVASLTRALAEQGPDTLLIQGTKAPQVGDDLSAFVPALTGFRGTFVDLVYAQPSALYHAALAQGRRAQAGGPMLIEQARLAQTLWWGRAASYSDMAAALRDV